MQKNSVCRSAGWLAFATLIPLMGMGVAHASGPQAWAEHDQAVAAACLKASGFNKPAVVGTPVAFDDTVGQTALLVAGTYPQKHMAGKKGQMLCLYDRRAKTAQTQEWPAATRAPARGK